MLLFCYFSSTLIIHCLNKSYKITSVPQEGLPDLRIDPLLIKENKSSLTTVTKTELEPRNFIQTNKWTNSVLSALDQEVLRRKVCELTITFQWKGWEHRVEQLNL